jgi:hypothetical protein
MVTFGSRTTRAACAPGGRRRAGPSHCPGGAASRVGQPRSRATSLVGRTSRDPGLRHSGPSRGEVPTAQGHLGLYRPTEDQVAATPAAIKPAPAAPVRRSCPSPPTRVSAFGVDYQHYPRAQAEVIVDTTTLVVLGGLGPTSPAKPSPTSPAGAKTAPSQPSPHTPRRSTNSRADSKTLSAPLTRLIVSSNAPDATPTDTSKPHPGSEGCESSPSKNSHTAARHSAGRSRCTSCSAPTASTTLT